MACDAQALLAAAKCFECKYQGLMYDAVEVVLLCAIRDGESPDCDPDALLAEASCLLCTIPPGAFPAVKLSLLCDIANA